MRGASHVVAIGPNLPATLKQSVGAALWGEDSGPLVGWLEKAAGVRVSGVLVYGSLVLRSAAEGFGSSDADLLVLVEEPTTGGVFGRSDDLDIDLHIQTRANTLEDFVLNHIFFGARVLFDARAPELAGWLDLLRQWRCRDSAGWTAADRLRESVWARRLLERISRLGLLDRTVASMYEARLFAALPTLYAVTRGQHTSSISHWWMEMQTSDAEFAGEVVRYVSQRASLPAGAAMRALLDKLYVDLSKTER